jgi:hypothetical protein
VMSQFMFRKKALQSDKNLVEGGGGDLGRVIDDKGRKRKRRVRALP